MLANCLFIIFSDEFHRVSKPELAGTLPFRSNFRFSLLVYLLILFHVIHNDILLLSFRIQLKSTRTKYTPRFQNNKKIPLNQTRYYMNCYFVKVSLLVLMYANAFMWLSVLLIRSGDIQLNPGPLNESYSSTFSSVPSVSADHSKYLSVIHHNVQSILPKLDEIYIELKGFDILTFSETWLNENTHTDDLHLTSFHSPERKDRASNRYGGVILYVKSCFAYSRRRDLEPDGLECIWVDLFLNHKHILVGTFYRPPGSTAQYFDLIEESIQLAVDTNINDIIITGDFNFDLLKPATNRFISSLCHQFGLQQIIEEPTHFTENSSSLIDIFLVSNVSSIISSCVCDPYLNQNVRYHCPVLSVFNFQKPRFKTFERKVWRYDNADYDLLREKAAQVNWTEFEENSVDEFNSDILKKIHKVTEECIPNKSVKVRPFEPPWINTQIKRKIRCRKRAYKKAKLRNTEYLWQNFRRIRNETTQLIRQCKKQYYENLANKLHESNVSCKDWWKILKSFIKQNDKSQIPTLSSEDKSISDSTEKADLLNEYFSKQSTLNDQHKQVPQIENCNVYLPTPIINTDEVKDVLRSLQVGKASGPDEINNRILRELANVLSNPLCKLFNKSLNESRVPSTWKEANVCAIYKKGDPSQVGNYRPVSLLSNLDKAMERILFKYIFNFLKDNDFLSSYQSGFIPGDSTVNQLTFLYNSFCKALDEGKEIRVIFFDISKAFDRVWHKGLVAKLKGAGINGKLLSWLQNYLTDRRQRVVIPGGTSEWSFIRAGVPQGSILGPLMFLIYINDIVNSIQSNIRLFADDTSLYLIVDHPDTTAIALQNDISVITNWANKWLVNFNPAKTESLLISRKINKPDHPTLTMLNEDITEVETHKHLGIILSGDGSWHHHIEFIKTKAWQRVNIMRKLKYLLNRKSLEIIYTSFIRPILEYANVIWDNCTEYEKQDLEKIQNEAGRIATGCTKLVSLRDLYKETGWDTLSTRRNNQKLLLFYKMINNLTPSYLASLVPAYVLDSSNYNLRNSNNLRSIHARTQLYSASFLPSVISSWNELPVHVRNSTTVSSFKYLMSSQKAVPPVYYYIGQRKGQILHTRLRANCSTLNLCLFQKGIVESPLCVCGEVESTDHFILRCPLYQTVRNELINAVESFCTISTEILLFGNPHLPAQSNILMFEAFHRYIISSKRFE